MFVPLLCVLHNPYSCTHLNSISPLSLLFRSIPLFKICRNPSSLLTRAACWVHALESFIEFVSILNDLTGILPTLSAPDLHSSVSNGSLVYPEQPITITCVTRNSQILAWESTDYIGGRSQITFTSNNQPDSTDTSRNGAVAILISVTSDNGELVITSELLINITTRSIMSSVTCHNVDSGQTDNIVFHRTNESATELVYPNKTKICPDERISITCMARNTSIIQWSSRSLSNGQIHCIRNDPVIRNDTIGNTDVDILTEYSATDLNGNALWSRIPYS